MLDLNICKPEFTEREQVEINAALSNPAVRKHLEAKLLDTLTFIQGTPVPTSSPDQQAIIVSDTLICKGAMQYFQSIYDGEYTS